MYYYLKDKDEEAKNQVWQIMEYAQQGHPYLEFGWDGFMLFILFRGSYSNGKKTKTKRNIPMHNKFLRCKAICSHTGKRCFKTEDGHSLHQNGSHIWVENKIKEVAV